MRIARFQNWLRSWVGLPRKPINYSMKAKGAHLGLRTSPSLWQQIKAAWAEGQATTEKQA